MNNMGMQISLINELSGKQLWKIMTPFPLNIYPEVGCLDHIIVLFIFSLLHFTLFFYTIVLVSSVQQHESTIIIHVFPLSWASFLCPPSNPFRSAQNSRLGFLCLQKLLTSYPLYTESLYMLMLLSPFFPEITRASHGCIFINNFLKSLYDRDLTHLHSR